MDYFASIVLGFVASHIQSDKIKKHSSRWAYFVAFTSCFVISIIFSLFHYVQNGNFDVNNLLGTLGVAFASSQTYYNLYFKDKLNGR